MDGLIPILAQSSSNELSGAEVAVILTTIFAIFVLAFLFYVVPMWFIYKKAGKPGWAAIVPFYNLYVHAEIIGRNPLIVALFPVGLFILSFIPLVNLLSAFLSFFFGAIIAYDTAIVFRQSQGLAIANIFLSPFINFYLAFSSNAQYQGPLYGAEQRILLEAPWLDPALGVQGINPYAPQVYGATGDYNPNAAASYQPMGYNPTGAGMPGQPPLGTQPGMPTQPPVVGQPGQPGVPGQPGQPGQPGVVGQPGQPGVVGQPGQPGQPGVVGQPGQPGAPVPPPAAGGAQVATSAADWGPAPNVATPPPATPAADVPPATPTDGAAQGDDGSPTNPFDAN